MDGSVKMLTARVKRAYNQTMPLRVFLGINMKREPTTFEIFVMALISAAVVYVLVWLAMALF
jgi:hypothetical protein